MIVVLMLKANVRGTNDWHEMIPRAYFRAYQFPEIALTSIV